MCSTKCSNNDNIKKSYDKRFSFPHRENYIEKHKACLLRFDGHSYFRITTDYLLMIGIGLQH
jgi:hypothetical protein